MVLAVVVTNLNLGMEEELIKSFSQIREAHGSASAPGVIKAPKLYRDVDNPSRLAVISEWENKKAHKDYINSPESSEARERKGRE